MKAENGGRQMKNIWRLPTPGAAEKQFGKHPTQKPVALIARCLRASTNPGDLVMDLFAGSGSTGVAALELGRRFIGIEREAGYAALAAKRLRDAARAAVTSPAAHEVPRGGRSLTLRRQVLQQQEPVPHRRGRGRATGVDPRPASHAPVSAVSAFRHRCRPVETSAGAATRERPGIGWFSGRSRPTPTGVEIAVHPQGRLVTCDGNSDSSCSLALIPLVLALVPVDG